MSTLLMLALFLAIYGILAMLVRFSEWVITPPKGAHR